MVVKHKNNHMRHKFCLRVVEYKNFCNVMHHINLFYIEYREKLDE